LNNEKDEIVLKKPLYKMVTCCDDAYWPTMERFLKNYNNQNQDFNNLILYNLGLNENNLKKLNEFKDKYKFITRDFNYENYPDYVDIRKRRGLNNSYAFKPILIYEELQKQEECKKENMPLIYFDSAIGFYDTTILEILELIKENNFWINKSASKHENSAIQLSYRKSLEYFNINKGEIDIAAANAMGMNYTNEKTKLIIDEWYNLALTPEVLIPEGSNRNNHRQDQTILSCILHKYNYKNFVLPKGLQPGKNTYYLFPWKFWYEGLKEMRSYKKNSNVCEGCIHVYTLENGYEELVKRLEISKEELLEKYKIVF